MARKTQPEPRDGGSRKTPPAAKAKAEKAKGKSTTKAAPPAPAEQEDKANG